MTVAERVWLLPTVTLPKLRLLRFEANRPEVFEEFLIPVPPALMPWQPTKMARDVRRSRLNTALNTFFEVVFLAADLIIVSQETATYGSTDRLTGGRLIPNSVARPAALG